MLEQKHIYVNHAIFTSYFIVFWNSMSLNYAYINVLIGKILIVFQGWTMYAQLLISLFKFLAPFLRNVELAAPIQTLYKVSTLTFQ